MKLNKISSIRILTQSKNVFKSEGNFRYFIEKELSHSGTRYCVINSMMNCPKNTLVLFQYDGKIRAFGVILGAVREPIIDDSGTKCSGYYLFDNKKVKYLECPIDKVTMQEIIPDFKGFSQSKTEIPMEYEGKILKLLEQMANMPKGDIKIIQNAEKCEIQGSEKQALVKIRINQGKFRQKLIKRYCKCCLCGVGVTDVLVASHIKPWAKSNPLEQTDVNNGLLLCPNHDALFDKGLITFDRHGKILISDRLSSSDRKMMNIKKEMKINVCSENQQFLEYHRKKIFQNR